VAADVPGLREHLDVLSHVFSGCYPPSVEPELIDQPVQDAEQVSDQVLNPSNYPV